ncbi:MAG: hypothetical protein K5644_05740 [Lachnospiraceae bacterium]|nr:hypothetical protein [Lachnospiraceae bacterium]
MSITAVGFTIFFILSIISYYIIPVKFRWGYLIILSFVYIYSISVFGGLFIIFTATITYFTARLIEKSDNHKKAWLICGMALSLAVLIILKYVLGMEVFNHDVTFMGEVYAYKIFMRNFIVPAGLSYYTLQVLSYMLDVYWGRQKAETNYFKILLFTSYFPQMVQGPISKYSELAPELFKEHRLDWHNIKYGLQLMLWGFFKKLVVADRVGTYVTQIFTDNPDVPHGATVWLGFICFGVQLYCDFSGGIDIIRGVSQCFGINMKENFRQPYFSLSIGEFWRRWHISLGQWMKDYIFYPVSMSRWLGKTKKGLKKVVSRKMSNRIGMAIADVFVFIFVGVWHGLGTNYLAWGLYNGIILAISAILVDVYVVWKKKLHINDQSKGYKAFMLIRSLFLITLGWVFDCTTSMKDAFVMVYNSIRFDLTDFTCLELQHWDWFILPLGIGLVLLVDILHEKKISIRDELSKKNYWLQVAVWVLLIQAIACFVSVSFAGGFMYANF